MPTPALPALTLACALPALLRGQPPAPGFAAEVVHSETGSYANLNGFAAGRDGRSAWVAWQNLAFALDGRGGRQLAFALPAGHWIGTILTDPRDDRVWVTDFATDALLVYDPRTAVLQPSGSAPRNTFALAVEPRSGVLLASANPLWPAPGAANGIWAIEPAQARVRELVRLSGPSGPIAFSGDGDLLYATQSPLQPPPPGSTDLLRLPAARLSAALAGGPRLSLADLSAVRRGLDGAFGLAVDGRDVAYLTDAARGGVQRVDLASGRLDPVPLFAPSGTPATGIQFVAGPGPAPFVPWQPEGGGALLLARHDPPAVRTEILRVTSARPRLAVLPAAPVPRGPARLELSGGVPLGAAAVFLSPLPPVPETAFPLLGVPVWIGLDPSFPALAWPAPTDGNGRGQWPFVHAGGAPPPLSVQAFCIGADGRHGTSPPLLVTFG